VVFPPGFFDRLDPTEDRYFYAQPRMVTHIDERAIAAVGTLYEDLGVRGEVLDLMSSWTSHLAHPVRRLTVLGMNRFELDANQAAAERVVHDLNADPTLLFADDSFDAALCCVSVDYLLAPVEVFAEVSRVVRTGGLFVCTFSNRLFPTKAIAGWLAATDDQRGQIVQRYFQAAGGWGEPTFRRCTPPEHPGDPLFAVWARNAKADSATPR
jgi:SAM-dependent methyltransferase